MEVQLNDVAQRIPAGHRLRIAVSTQAWPLVWPASQKMTLELLTGKSVLTLPLLESEKINDLKTAQPDTAAIPLPLAMTWKRPVKRERKITRDAAGGKVSRVYLKDDGAYRIQEHGMEISALGTLTYTTEGEDPLTAVAEYSYQISQARDDWKVTVECDIRVTADADNFYLSGEYRAIEDEQIIKRRSVNMPIERKHV